MDSALKKNWVTALRSGDYEQGRSFLHCGDQFCCLGVLLDQIDHDKWEEFETAEGKTIYQWGGGFALPDREILDLSIATKYTDMNDDQRCTFAEIADAVEQDGDL